MQIKRKLRPELREAYIQSIRHIDAVLDLMKDHYVSFKDGKECLIKSRAKILDILESYEN